MRAGLAAAAMAAVVIAGCGSGDVVDFEPEVVPASSMATESPVEPEPAEQRLMGLAYEDLAEGFDTPVFVTAPAGDDRLWVVEKEGAIKLIVDGAVADEPYLDLTPFVGSDGTELGLTGLAFHPEFHSNGRLFVMYTNRFEDSRIVEFSADPAADRADDVEGRVILAVDQPHEWHNGGHLAFGPDGYLWFSLGDGGNIGDPKDHGQRPETMLGSIGRIDVNTDAPYAVPDTNPFITGGGRPEVWAYGLRNPYRFAVDPITRLVHIGDVGQFEWEEIDVVSVDDPGHNFGWAVREGPECYEAAVCASGFTEPLVTYSHKEGCVVVAGPVYRGADIPELWGHHLYADYCLGKVFSYTIVDGLEAEHRDRTISLGRRPFLTSIGVDGRGEPVATFSDGRVARIVAER